MFSRFFEVFKFLVFPDILLCFLLTSFFVFYRIFHFFASVRTFFVSGVLPFVFCCFLLCAFYFH
ncbi:hypothetical protein DRJ22_03615 [Candidatus Woesearchaeota archaeon]|nr:MAG: hypothetical protein DRJ22_03615 [Candidatus Woesearchaeota archaeon]